MTLRVPYIPDDVIERDAEALLAEPRRVSRAEFFPAGFFLSMKKLRPGRERIRSYRRRAHAGNGAAIR